MARSRRGVSTRHARAVANKGSQKTKVRAVVSQLDWSGALATVTISQAVDTARANYYDIYVKPFARIQVLHLDIAIYQSGASVSPDGFVDWAIIKNPGGSITPTNPNGTGLTMVPYTFKTSRAAVPMLSATGLPCVYHLSGDIKIPPRFQIQTPGDTIQLVFTGLTGAGVTYSVNGTVTYMFKV